MRILLVGAGGVGSALARIAARRPFAELVIADYDLARAQHAAAAKDGVPLRLSPPNGQPAQKSYRDWNGGGTDASWAVTEPGIYYQSAYVRLLSAFVK